MGTTNGRKTTTVASLSTTSSNHKPRSGTSNGTTTTAKAAATRRDSNGAGMPRLDSVFTRQASVTSRVVNTIDVLGKANPMVSSIETLAQKKGVNTQDERFKVTPDYAYPNTWLNREGLRTEMNKKSFFFHNLRLDTDPPGVGQVALEIMQCFGLPKPDNTLGSEVSAFCIAVCGAYAFRTDCMPPVANPMWLSRMRRASIFPVYQAYSKLYIGVFGHHPDSRRDGFAGRIVVDLASLRPNCTYDVTLPLRRSSHVYSREQRGAIRVRIHLSWFSERAALLSYLPRSKKISLEPQEDVVVRCCDDKSFQNVARVLHGDHMPGRFTTKQFRATVKEFNLTRIRILRHLRKRELRNLRQWRVPVLSAFLFGAWMHCVYTATVKYVPGHVLTFLLLYIWKNYAYYRLQESAVQNGFVAPSWEEMFVALLFGRPNTIAPLEMQAKEEAVKSVMDDIADANKRATGAATSLADIAKVFRSDMKVHKERQQLRKFRHVFTGKEAVDFLVDRGYAESRGRAVVIGQQLMQKLKLFQGARKNIKFEDDSSLYQFIDYDPLKYTLRTYTPRGKRLFRLLNFLPEHEPPFSEGQLEMPYALGNEAPRFTVKEALVIRSKESMKMMMEDEPDTDPNMTQSQNMTAGLDALLEEDNKTIHPNVDDLATVPIEMGDPNFEIKMLKTPPPQDIDFKPTQKPRHITAVLAEARHKFHGFLLGHAFNDRVYPKPYPQQFFPQISARAAGKGRFRKILSKKLPSFSENHAASVASEEEMNPAAIEDEYNRLLEIGIYSTTNPLFKRIGVVVQPIVEMVLGGLSAFRALFNIFTWRDPILTFWITLLGPVLVLILHFFPWRVVMGIVGVVLFGPQNYFIRVYHEYKFGPEEFDPDKIVKKRKKPKAPDGPDVPYFSMYAPENQFVCNEDRDHSVLRKVVVPNSPLMYNQRFYDFPPETEYARVVAERPPAEHLTDVSRVGGASCSMDGSSSQASLTRSKSKWGSKVRGGFRRRRR